jgi:hypothetical protein
LLWDTQPASDLYPSDIFLPLIQARRTGVMPLSIRVLVPSERDFVDYAHKLHVSPLELGRLQRRQVLVVVGIGSIRGSAELMLDEAFLEHRNHVVLWVLDKVDGLSNERNTVPNHDPCEETVTHGADDGVTVLELRHRGTPCSTSEGT